MEFYVLYNGKPLKFIGSLWEARELGNGRVFNTRAECLEALNGEVEKPRYISDEERKRIEALQLEWGRSLLTEEEKAIIREKRKNIDQVQREFGRYMMRKEKRCQAQL